ncbi:Protein Skeletor,isoforms B/C [Trichinella pseudospiralis]
MLPLSVVNVLCWIIFIPQTLGHNYGKFVDSVLSKNYDLKGNIYLSVGNNIITITDFSFNGDLKCSTFMVHNNQNGKKEILPYNLIATAGRRSRRHIIPQTAKLNPYVHPLELTFEESSHAVANEPMIKDFFELDHQRKKLIDVEPQEKSTTVDKTLNYETQSWKHEPKWNNIAIFGNVDNNDVVEMKRKLETNGKYVARLRDEIPKIEHFGKNGRTNHHKLNFDRRTKIISEERFKNTDKAIMRKSESNLGQTDQINKDWLQNILSTSFAENHQKLPSLSKERINEFDENYYLKPMKNAMLTISLLPRGSQYFFIYDHCKKDVIVEVDLFQEDSKNVDDLPPFYVPDIRLQSGSLMILDCSTLLIPDFTYTPTIKSNISFCAYLHDQEKIDLIFVDSDQKSGLHDITRRYNGEDVMLKIPKQYNLRDINSVELFNTETKQTYASISIGKIKNC